MYVQLTMGELFGAACIGVRRQCQAVYRQARTTYGSKPNEAWQCQIEGACGEMAVAKHLGRFWSGNLGDLDAADVGHLQVRTTSHDAGCLIVHPEDADDGVFILVTGLAPHFVLRGWMLGRDAKKDAFWKDGPRPAYFVPQGLLLPIGELA